MRLRGVSLNDRSPLIASTSFSLPRDNKGSDSFASVAAAMARKRQARLHPSGNGNDMDALAGIDEDEEYGDARSQAVNDTAK